MLLKFLSVLLAPLIMLTNYLGIEQYEIPEAAAMQSETEPEVNSLEKTLKVNGINGSVFYIKSPVRESCSEKHTSEFGMSAELQDNSSAFQAALNYCSGNPGTLLVIDPGVYRFTGNNLLMDSLSDTFIDGTGAEFIFSKTGTQISLRHCSCLEINGLSVDWDRENDPISDVVRIKNADSKKHTLDLEFFQRDNVNPEMVMSAITQCDPESLTFGADKSSKEVYLYQDPENIQSVEKVSSNVLRVVHNGCMNNFSDGDVFILRHHVYDGTVFSIGGNSENITFDHVNIYGGSGMAYHFTENCSHFRISNGYIGIDPSANDTDHCSLGADAIHIVNTMGHFLIEDCDMSGMGDDAVNVHDGLGYIHEVEGAKAEISASAMKLDAGDTISFKDMSFKDSDFTAKLVSVTQDGNRKTVTFDRDISSDIRPGFTAFNKAVDSGCYVIRNNYFHENRARALLLQSDNGLCENNRFYKIEGMAIRIIMDIRPTLWQEGTGVDNLTVRNNTFEKCDYSGWGCVIEMSTYIDGRPATVPIFTNIRITGNTFAGSDAAILDADNVNGLEFTGNTVTSGRRSCRAKFRQYCYNVSYSDNNFSREFLTVPFTDRLTMLLKMLEDVKK